MKVLLKSAVIVDASSKHHLKKRDILIDNGTIVKIAAKIQEPKAKEVSLPQLHVSAGWFDSSVCFGEPGFEERETIDNGLTTAAKSGFSHVAVNTNTHPVADSKSHIKFLKTRAEDHAVHLYPMGALSAEGKGQTLAELYDMHQEGAIGFYDYQQPIENPNLLKIALQYTQGFGGTVVSFPFETSIAVNGVVNEEVNSTRLGLKGIPALAEELQIARDLYLLEYAGGRLHIPTISTQKSVQLIKEAKKKGLQVSCSVAATHLALTDDVLEEFDTNFKLLPPLRTKKDVSALIKGLKDGVIDGVTSDHNPIDIEHKKTEFDYAMYGSIGLESCFGTLNKAVGLETAVNALTGLKSNFGIPNAEIAEGTTADLTLFNPTTSWVFETEDIQSASKNAAMLGQDMLGKAYGIYANGQLIL